MRPWSFVVRESEFEQAVVFHELQFFFFAFFVVKNFWTAKVAKFAKRKLLSIRYECFNLVSFKNVCKRTTI